MASAPKEYTPEITEDYYDTLSRKIQQRGDADVGRARGEALARGRAGDPFETSAVGMSRAGTSQELGDLYAGLNWNVAGLQREERLGGVERDFQAGEAEKERGFRETMAKRGYDFQNDFANTQNRRSQQAALWQIPLGAGSKALGAWAGGGF